MPPAPSQDSSQDKSVSLRQIAEVAGVSRMTASRAFKKNSSIKPDVRQKILKVAKELGYKPDAMVSELMTSFASRRPANYKETFAAIWWPQRWAEVSFGEGYHSDIYNGLNEGSKLHGRSIDHFVITENMPARVINRILHARNIQGVILTPNISTDETAPDLDWEHLSVVTIGSSLIKLNFHRAQASHYNVIVKSLERLHDQKYKRPCLLLHRNVDARTHRAYTAAFLAWGHPRKHIWQADFHQSKDLPLWLKQVKPDIIIADWDTWFDEIPPESRTCSFMSLSVRSKNGPITGIYQNTKNIAKCAVDLLVRARLEHQLGEPHAPVLMVTAGTWVEGCTMKTKL